MKNKSIVKTLVLAALVLGSTSCATKLSKPKQSPQPSSVRFSKFDKVEVKEVVLAPAFADSGSSERARKKINELLQSDLRSIFSNTTLIGSNQNFHSGTNSLQITPIIEEIKFVSIAKRILFGTMAGGSAALIKVEYRDGATGKVIAVPQFYRDSNAFTGGFSFGASDNKMLEEIAHDISRYSSNNK